MPSKNLHITLIFMTIFFFLIALFTTQKNGNTQLMNAFATNFVISSVFYFMVAYLPERQKRNRIRRRMEKQYKEFKLSCIDIFLIMSSSQEYQNREMLLELSEFRRYFKNNNTQSETRWDAVANGVQGSEFYLKELVHELNVLSEGLCYVRSAIDIHDEEVFDFLRRASQIIRRLETTEPNYDDIKSLCRSFWEIFAGWSFVDGYREADVINDMLVKIN